MKISIVGCGRVFGHYYKLINGIDSIDIVEAFDINPNISLPSDVTAVKQLDDIAESESDLVCVLTPSHTHYDIAKFFIEHNKNVLVEKPLTLIPSQGHHLNHLAKSRKVLLFCAFQNRFNKAIQEASQVLSKNLIGDLVSCHVSLEWCRFQEYYDDDWHGRWACDGGVIAQQAIHHIDAALLLTGLPKRVIGLGRNVSNKLEAEDTFTGLIELYNGLVITLSATTSIRPVDKQAKISITGTKGSINIDGIALNEFTLSSPSLSYSLREDFANGYGLSHVKLLHAIANVMGLKQKTDNPLLSIDLSIQTTEVISSLYSSWESGVWSDAKTSISSKWGTSN